jgi:hypothetical protein
VDLQRKLQEDPLIALRKKELDTRKKILDNPIKMKQIQSYVRFFVYQGAVFERVFKPTGKTRA